MGILWFRGYTVLEIESLCAERFFNLCANRGIRIHKLYPEKDKCIFATSIDDYYKLRPIAKKTKPHIKIRKKTGLPFVTGRVLKHQFFIAGIILFAVVIMILGRFVWNIRIDGNYMNSDDTMYRYLKENGITYGTRISAIDCEQLEAQIRRDFDNIIWVSVAVHGTSLDVDVRENQDETDYGRVTESMIKTPSDIVSLYDGVVYSVVARNGTPTVKKADVVKKGDVLISGTFVTLDESYQPIKEEYVYADGDVSLLVEFTYSDVLDRGYIKKEYTGHSYKSVGIRAFNFTVPFNMYHEKYELCETVTSSSNFCLYQDFYLPFGADTTVHREYTLNDSFYTDEEMENILEQNFAYYLQKIEEKGIQIIENNVTITINDEQAQMSGSVYVIESECGREEIKLEYN